MDNACDRFSIMTFMALHGSPWLSMTLHASRPEADHGMNTFNDACGWESLLRKAAGPQERLAAACGRACVDVWYLVLGLQGPSAAGPPIRTPLHNKLA